MAALGSYDSHVENLSTPPPTACVRCDEDQAELDDAGLCPRCLLCVDCDEPRDSDDPDRCERCHDEHVARGRRDRAEESRWAAADHAHEQWRDRS